MCMCGKPNVNGTPNAYSWEGKVWMTRQPCPPDLREGDELLYDEPGRCGGIDAHSHHFRLVKRRGDYVVLVRHGGGDDSVALGCVGRFAAAAFDTTDSNGRYWLMHTLYSAQEDATRRTRETVAHEWRKAAAEKRIRTRKQPGRNAVRVWIETPAAIAA